MTTEAKTPTTGQLVRQRPSGVDDRQARLDELEAVVRRGFYEAGKALREIRDSKLYALREKSWEHHCRNRLESTKTTINRLIDATKTADAALKIAGQGTKMTPIGVTDLVQNEHQARLLKPHLPELNRRVVVEGVDPQEATKAILDRARREEVKAKQAKLEQQLKRQSTSPSPAQPAAPPVARPRRGSGARSPVALPPDPSSTVKHALTELLDLLNDPATKAAFEQHADLAEQIWKRLRPAWWGRRPVL